MARHGFAHMKHTGGFALITIIAVLVACLPSVMAANAAAEAISGVVRDAAGGPVAGATVYLENENHSIQATTTTDPQGKFSVPLPGLGHLSLRIQKAGFHDAVRSLELAAAQHEPMALVLSPLNPASHNTARSPSSDTMQLHDNPDFTVAGITDWTAAGGHGSDANLRASESLARETRTLGSASPHVSPEKFADKREAVLRSALAREPESFTTNHVLGDFYLQSGRFVDAVPLLAKAHAIDSASYENAYALAQAYNGSGDHQKAKVLAERMLRQKDCADLHRLLGDVNENLHDPLGAEREYESAARQDPTEQNYFAWATELLVHRAIEPAIEMFNRGLRGYPRSERMLAGLGAALYANGVYEAAAQRVCEASDLNPADPNPYLFLGKMEQFAPQVLPCVEEKLARFAHDQPDSALANYYYALALNRPKASSKKDDRARQAQALLEKAVQLDPNLGEAYVQLGIVEAERGNPAAAVAWYRRAIAANADLSEAHFRLAQSYKRAGENENAEREFQIFERLRKSEAAVVEQQRREVRQFVVVLKNHSQSPAK